MGTSNTARTWIIKAERGSAVNPSDGTSDKDLPEPNQWCPLLELCFRNQVGPMIVQFCGLAGAMRVTETCTLTSSSHLWTATLSARMFVHSDGPSLVAMAHLVVFLLFKVLKHITCHAVLVRGLPIICGRNAVYHRKVSGSLRTNQFYILNHFQDEYNSGVVVQQLYLSGGAEQASQAASASDTTPTMASEKTGPL